MSDSLAGGGGAPRQIRRRRPLPTGRAVAGGFLVAISVLGIFAAWSAAGAEPATRFVVARHDLVVGSRIGADDLTSLPMELPVGVAAFGDHERAKLVGATILGPVAKGELVQASDVDVDRASSAGKTADLLEVSFPIDRANAVGGSLRAGQFVDVLATFGSGSDTYTTTVVPGARVLDVGKHGTVGFDTGSAVVTLAVATADDARAVVHAVNAGEVVLVRTAPTGDDSTRRGTYRAPSAGAETRQ